MRKFYAQRALFGIKRPAFTWGHGDGASPHIRRRCCECAQVLRGAHGGSGPATAGVWGRHQPPHSKTSALFSKIISAGFMPARASHGMQHPMLPGGVGRAAPQNKHTHFYARKAQFGIKRPAFTRGHGGGVSPHIQPHTLQTWADVMPEGHNLGVRFCGFAGLVLEGGVGFQEGFGKGLAHD